MDPTLVMRAVISVLLWGVLIWFAWNAWHEHLAKANPLLPATAEPIVSLDEAARHIFARGGPLSPDDYRTLFPNSCPRCGCRSRYEKYSTTEYHVSLTPPITTPFLPRYLWSCTRCGFGTTPRLEHDPEARMRTIHSPYLAPDAEATIAEPPYDDSQIEEPAPQRAYATLRIEGAAFADIAHIPPTADIRLVLVNDEVTPMDFVVHVLQAYFQLPHEVAVDHMLQAHHTGESEFMHTQWSVVQPQVLHALRIAQAMDIDCPLTLVLRLDPGGGG